MDLSEGEQLLTKIALGSLQTLPRHLLYDIVNRLGDAKIIAYCQASCPELRDAGKNVQSYHLICREAYHHRARVDSQAPTLSAETSDEEPPKNSSSSSKFQKYRKWVGESSQSYLSFGNRSFKEQMEMNLKDKKCLVQLRFEVESKLQSKPVPEGERRRTDFWLSDPYFVGRWLPQLGGTLQHLCIVDYGQQAIMRRSSIVKLLSEICKKLKTLDLRNMFIDMSGCEKMFALTSVTLRCVKVNGEALQQMNIVMPKLQTLALLGVFGVDEAILKLEDLKILCLGLSTPAKKIEMDLSQLEKLQLKMKCPGNLIIRGRSLKYVAFNLDVSESSKVTLDSLIVEELLYGAPSFGTLLPLVDRNVLTLKKIFLDIPCMALAEDGRFLRVLKDIPLHLPSFDKLHQCKSLEVLNIGPGLWYAMEKEMETIFMREMWPSMSKLILHMIPHDMDCSILVLRKLLQSSVTSLQIYIHTSSLIGLKLMTPRIKEVIEDCDQIQYHEILPWTKSLDFSCFSF